MSRRSFPYESRNVPALQLRLQARGGPEIELDGIVDSGATCTVLSLQVADHLGLSDLREAHDATLAGGIQIPARVSDTPIRAQVQAPLSPGGPLEPWGPIFELHPMFLQTGPALWGQEDFFNTFDIALYRRANPSVFTLTY